MSRKPLTILAALLTMGITACTGSGPKDETKSWPVGQAAAPSDAPAGVLAPVANANTSLVSNPQAQSGRNVAPMSLYGEMPGSPRTAPADGMENMRQVSFTQEGADFDVTVDRAGEYMIFASTRHRPTADLYYQKIGGNTVTQLTADPGRDEMPAISPDGGRIAFCSDRSGSWDVYVKDLRGGKAIQVTSDPAHEIHPSWSADGNQVVFSCLGTQSGQWEMVVVDIANPAQRRFIGYGLFPKFSPDGKKILFQRARFRGTRWFSVWTIDYQNGEGSRPTEIAASSNAAAINPSWSPDGKKIVFSTVVNPSDNPTARPQQADLWVVNLDGTGRMRLSTDTYVNLQPEWGADGNIYFVSNRNGHDNLWSVIPTSSEMVLAGSKAPAQGQATVPTE